MEQNTEGTWALEICLFHFHFLLSKIRWGSEQNSPRDVRFALGVLTSRIRFSSLFSFQFFFFLNKALLCITGWSAPDCVVQSVLKFMAVS